MNQKIVKALKISKIAAQVILLIVSLFWFTFAILSGSEELGGGIQGLLRNAMNGLPWLILLGFNYLAYRWNLAGGIILFGFAWFCFFLFDMYKVEQLPVFFLIFVPLFLIASIFIGNGIMKIRSGENNQ